MPWYRNQNGQCLVFDDERALTQLHDWIGQRVDPSGAVADIKAMGEPVGTSWFDEAGKTPEALVAEHGDLYFSLGPVTMTMTWYVS